MALEETTRRGLILKLSALGAQPTLCEAENSKAEMRQCSISFQTNQPLPSTEGK